MTHRKARLSPISLYSSAPLLDISNRCCADPVSWSRLSPELLPKSSNRIVTALRCYLAGHTALAGTEVFGESPELSIPGRTRILVKDAVIREIIDKLIPTPRHCLPPRPTPHRRLRRTRRLIGVGHGGQGSGDGVGVGCGADQCACAGNLIPHRIMRTYVQLIAQWRVCYPLGSVLPVGANRADGQLLGAQGYMSLLKSSARSQRLL